MLQLAQKLSVFVLTIPFCISKHTGSPILFGRSKQQIKGPSLSSNVYAAHLWRTRTRFHRSVHGVRCQFHVKSIRVNAGKKRDDVAAQKQWPVWQLSAGPIVRLSVVSRLLTRARSLLCSSWLLDKSREPAIQSPMEPFRPVYRVNLRAVLVTFAESSGISGADGIVRREHATSRKPPASRSLEKLSARCLRRFLSRTCSSFEKDSVRTNERTTMKTI